jgi:hypothetical protein
MIKRKRLKPYLGLGLPIWPINSTHARLAHPPAASPTDTRAPPVGLSTHGRCLAVRRRHVDPTRSATLPPTRTPQSPACGPVLPGSPPSTGRPEFCSRTDRNNPRNATPQTSEPNSAPRMLGLSLPI